MVLDPNQEEPAKEGADEAGTKWWVDVTERVQAKRPAGPAGMSFFTVAHDFEQEKAKERLTDINPKILAAANPPQGGWAYISLAETTYPEKERERLMGLVALPSYARGVFVDCGRSVRMLVTGTPQGERLLDLTLSDAPSFDCWIHNDWVREQLFDDVESAVLAFRGLVVQYLSPKSIALYDSIQARV